MLKSYIFVFCIFMISLEKAHARIIYDFTSRKSVNDWVVIDDGVMGGLSSGSINLDGDGNGLYRGYVSLENYGGFSSIRLRQKEIDLANYKYITLKVFGDNKFYQLRIKSRYYDRHVYAKEFYAENEWQVIKIPLKKMKPKFRGRNLRMKNFNSDSIVEFGILIGNKVNEDFKLLIDYISFE